MYDSDGFGSGIFDDDFDEIPQEKPQETPQRDEPDDPVMPEEKAVAEEPKATPPPTSEQTEEEKPRQRRPRAGSRDRDDRRRPERGRDRDHDRDRDRDRPRGRGPRRDDRGRGSHSVEMVHPGAAQITPSGVATGAGEAPAGTLVNQKIAILVDADLLDEQASNLFEARISYRKVFSHAVRGRSAIRAIAYMSEEEEGARAPFQDHLGTSGFDMVRRVGAGKGNWNVQITLDALAIAQKVDAIVLASANPVLLPLLETLRNSGVKVEVASFVPIEENPLAQAAQAYIPYGRGSLYIP